MVYSVIVLVLIVLVVTVTLSARQPPPPTIAEFAPQAVEQITEPTQDQSSGGPDAGSAGSSAGAAVPPVSPTPPLIDVPRVHTCVGDPPRQTEDPQSPPCVPYWAGDNGGATSKGVTRDEIRIAVPYDWSADAGPAIVAHFNRRYEFYGRQIRAMPFGASGGNDPARLTADGLKVDAELHAFGSVGYADANGNEHFYYDELGRRKIVSVNVQNSMLDERGFQRFHPYQWSYVPGVDVMSRNKALWACTSLASKPADFAGGLERGKPRKFGILNEVNPDGSKGDLDPMRRTLASCGHAVAAEAGTYHENTDDGRDGGEQAIVRMQSAGVTSLMCECHNLVTLRTMATKQGYFPEWLISTYGYSDEGVVPAGTPREQGLHQFGLTWFNKDKEMETGEQPATWAIRESDRNADVKCPLPCQGYRRLYAGLLVMAAGIQLAGPNLTPTSFAQGLQRATFPNPAAGAAPYYQASVGFSATDHTFLDDAALIWFSESDVAPQGWNPAYCYARSGARYAAGRKPWPSDYGGLFEQPCGYR